ncbi:hypothetical protein BCON_0297g00160 [Botryotinia convoluta]|uniref:Rhodopsin domain-containing protein n=1 Tax=Botryotinia convoluta TaxID=54673 RepID=A0A4Z1HF60_9HELO|nr:hypothetical protein BCON_0297g00160 [Botryotinia convoluta]
MGQYLLWIQPAKLVIGLKVLYAIDIINIFALSIPKLAILFLYKRLFIISKLTNYAIKCATYAVYAFIIVLEAIAVFQCVPISDAFKTGPRKSHRCIDNTAVLIWATVPSIVTDIVIFLIPVPMVWKLNVPLRVKIELAVEFIIGGFPPLGILAATTPTRPYICRRRIITLAANTTCCLFDLCMFTALPTITRGDY